MSIIRFTRVDDFAAWLAVSLPHSGFPAGRRVGHVGIYQRRPAGGDSPTRELRVIATVRIDDVPVALLDRHVVSYSARSRGAERRAVIDQANTIAADVLGEMIAASHAAQLDIDLTHLGGDPVELADDGSPQLAGREAEVAA